MDGAIVYLSAIGFALFIFPVHLYNYLYINTEFKYASLNIGVYGRLNLFNVNTVENNPREMQVNGKNKKIGMPKLETNLLRIFNRICIHKVVQLGDYGTKNDKNVYAALAQNALTIAIYKFIEANGGNTKLRNYTVLNEEHGSVRYYMKSVTIINAVVVTRILMLFILEKINES